MSTQILRSRGSPALSRYSFEENVRSAEELRYTLGKTIGSGAYAKVKAAWSPYEQKMIAIKIIEKRGATRDFLTKFLPREMQAVLRLDHPHILRVFRLVETPRQVYFMLEMAHNADLLDYINGRNGSRVPETEARYVMRSIAAGIAHCHDQDIVHRDLKCENIMITKEMHIKIGDFGFAREVNGKCSPASTPCGSFSYAAPELFTTATESTYDAKKADIWSMGCILYAMVCGRLPFGDDSQVAKNVIKPLNFPAPLTDDCKNILQFSMLNTDVEMRCNIGQLQICHWMRGLASLLTPYKSQIYTEKDQLPKVVFDGICDLSSASQSSPLSSVRADQLQPSHFGLVKLSTVTSSQDSAVTTVASTTALKEVLTRKTAVVTQQRRPARHQGTINSYV